MGKKYLSHDHDPSCTDKFDSILDAVGVETVKLPPRSPSLNRHAECFVGSIREECLDRIILSCEDQLRYFLSEYLRYYRRERIYRGATESWSLSMKETRARSFAASIWADC